MLSKIRSFLFLLAFIVGSSFADDLKLREGFYRLSHDNLSLPNDETMGLFGTSYLLKFDDSYAGLGVYSAVNGQRGGFFTGGVELGHQLELGSGFAIDGGLFVGGGGGGSAPQGGGLMLRPHASLTKTVSDINLGLGISQVKFPNGSIDSNQLSLQMDIPFGFVYKSSDSDTSNNNDVLTLDAKSDLRVGWKHHYMSPTYQRYMLDDGVKGTDGVLMSNDMDLVGFEYGTKLSKNYYGYLETAGAGSSGTDGFAEVLGGLGYSNAFGRNFGFNIKGALGAAGGGGVDTGGGLIHKQSIGLYLRPFDKVAFSTEVGRVSAFDGGLKATTAKIGLHYPFKLLSAGGYVHKASNYGFTHDGLWSVRAVNQTYLGSSDLRKNGSTDSVQVLGIKLDRYLDDDTYLTGQALAAYQGEAGGYAVGLVGAGQEFGVTERLKLFAEISAGVAGGGGINTGGGAIIQPMFGLSYKLDSDFSLQTSVGQLKSLNDGGDTNVIEFGLQYRFKTIE